MPSSVVIGLVSVALTELTFQPDPASGFTSTIGCASGNWIRSPVTAAVADSLGTRNVRMASSVPCGSHDGLTVTWAAARPASSSDEDQRDGGDLCELPHYGSQGLLCRRGGTLHLVHEADVGLAELRHLDLQDDLPLPDDRRIGTVDQDEATDPGLVHVGLDRTDVLRRQVEVHRDALGLPAGAPFGPVNCTVMLLTRAWLGVM